MQSNAITIIAVAAYRVGDYGIFNAQNLCKPHARERSTARTGEASAVVSLSGSAMSS